MIEMKRDYGTNGNNGTNGNFIDFRLFRYFRLFRNPSSFHHHKTTSAPDHINWEHAKPNNRTKGLTDFLVTIDEPLFGVISFFLRGNYRDRASCPDFIFKIS